MKKGIDQQVILQNNQMLQKAIGVLGGGLNFEATVSTSTAQLAQQVLAHNGLLISEHPPFKEEDPYIISKTYRIIAGLAKAMVLIQSDLIDSCRYGVRTFAGLNRPFGVIDFSQHVDFNKSISFAANRIILQKKKEGIADFGKLKPDVSVRLSKIIGIKGLQDYEVLIDGI